MKKFIVGFSSVISLILLSSLLFTGCKKNLEDLINLPPDPIDSSSDLPAFTAIGTPAGNPVTKTIGVAGGSLVSDDGRIELTIPAGALSGDKEITIQPITNECPGGLGIAYDLQPEGTRFAKPASLKFHYTDEDLGEMDPYLFYVAYQDSTSEWIADIIWRDVDTLAKTVTSDIKHFSAHVIGSGNLVITDPIELHQKETSNVSAVTNLIPAESKGNEESDLSKLPIQKPISNVTSWTVIGGPANGTISGTGSTATYTAPASVSKKRTVNISARYQYTTTVQVLKWNKGKKVKGNANVNYGIASGQITLLPNPFSYKVTVAFQQSGTNECFIDNYTDTSTMRVDVENDEVTISEIKNNKPKADPASGNTTDGKISCEWKNDNEGMINFTGASGNVSPGATAGSDKLVHIILEGEGNFAKWQVTDNVASLTSFSGGEPFPAFPPAIGFTLNKTDQVMTVTVPQNAAGITGSAKITVKVLP